MTNSAQTDGPIPFTLAIPEHPRSMAIIDGTVKPEGLQLNCVHEFKSTADRHSAMAQGKYDAAEMNSFEFLTSRAQGGNLVALPVFWVRGFRHGNVFCRKDSPIKTFAELKGKTIGVTLFNSSGIISARGMLHDYGATRESIRWIAAEGNPAESSSGKVNWTVLNKNRDILWEMLQSGDIDAAIFPGNEAYWSFNPGGSLYKQVQKNGCRAIQDDRDTIARYYRKTGVYPIVHTVTVKLDLAKKHPRAVQSLLQALRRARELAGNYETPEEKEQSAEEIRFLGYDPYSYKLADADKKALDTLMGYMVEDGSLKKKLPLESILVEGTI